MTAAISRSPSRTTNRTLALHQARAARQRRLRIAAAAVGFATNRTQIHQVLAVKSVDGRSGFPLRPDFT